ncbi:MAG: tRNA pseudouridine synthase A [Bacteroidetes bacterium]|nr:tRNA pseudouridine synthase A [Bacteroidota bacterium]
MSDEDQNLIESIEEQVESSRYFLHLAYDGTNFHGWQIQLNAISIQAVIKEALEKILNIPINLVGCGRTDTGVHATQYYAHFDSTKPLPDRFVMKLNAVLPGAIAIYDCIPVERNAHARFHAIERSYEYFIHTRKNPFSRNYSYEFLYYPLRWDLIHEATALIPTYTEFKPMIKMDKDNPQVGDHQWKFKITANRFLYNMIRRIVGTMVLIGREQLTLEEFKRVMDEQAEFKNIKLAPSNGLHLNRVIYPFIK